MTQKISQKNITQYMQNILKIMMFLVVFIATHTFPLHQMFAQSSPNYGNILDSIINNSTPSANNELRIEDRIHNISINTNALGGEQIRDFLAYVAIKILIPIFIFVGIIIAILGFYKLFFSTDEETQKKAWRYILRGMTGIILMVSAGYITNMLVGTDGLDTGSIFGRAGSGNNGLSGTEIASKIYTDIAFPFLKIMMYLVIGILFLLLVVHTFKYIFNNGEEMQKKSATILLYTAVGIIIILLAKSIVESIYGTYAEVISGQISNLGEIGTGIFDTLNFTVFYTAINRILGIASFLILLLIIYQSYVLLVQPHDEEQRNKLKRNVGYIFLGILVLGAGYLIVNFFIITK